jgi:hypothetical protein
MPALYLQGKHLLLETVSVQHLEERRILTVSASRSIDLKENKRINSARDHFLARSID